MRRSKKIWIGVGAAFLALAALSVIASFPNHRYSATLAFLKGATQLDSTSEYLHTLANQGLVGSYPERVSEVDTFVVPGNFEEVSKLASREVKPSDEVFEIYSGESEPHAVLQTLQGTEEGLYTTLTFTKEQGNRTSVVVQVYRSADWMDKLRHWIDGLQGRRPDPNTKGRIF